MASFTLLTERDKEQIIPFLSLLNDTISKDILEGRLTDMFAQGYRCVGIFDEEKLIGISGLWILTKYYVGKHIEPDNVIIHPDYRGAGVGEALMEWIHVYAVSQGCIAAELNCYAANNAGHKFWLNQGYNILGFHYQKKLVVSAQP
jgi:diamine N-acetyltransferase